MINYLFHVSGQNFSSGITVVRANTLTEAKLLLEREFEGSTSTPEIRLVESTENISFLN